MIIDTSAVVAILKAEPQTQQMVDRMLEEDSPRMSAASYLETAIVVDRLGDPALSRRLDEVLVDLAVEIADVTAAQARIARQAYRDYGKGSGHQAGLNFGDCFSYALAVETREPLLFKGDDFGHTDVTSALA
ncbi:MAG: type II toxin-antitoxin system VapC family toxin [Ornithinimicrobium sp.]|jgi:ribonuclease VapC|uniref:type II toxin-antitoxin system VapC family toxin n=1 Tax=Ornithinimicrobium sp. TaxID=1977084 RepID=UPI003D9B8506